MTPSPVTTPGLQEGFAAFIAAADQLERSYADLKARADRVDLQLADTNEQLAAALAEKGALVDALPIGLVQVDRDGTVHHRNRAAQELATKLRAHGRCLSELPDGEHRVAVDPNHGGALAVTVRRTPMPEAAGGGTLLLVEDRSEVAALQEEVARLDRLAGLSELALGIAHEIRNPLNGALGFAGLLQRASDPDRIQHYGGKITQGLQQVESIVQALLGFARQDPGAVVGVPIQALVQEAMAGAQLPRDRVRLAGDVMAPVPGDAVGRVLVNLFRNSVEAAGQDVTISVRVAIRGDRAEITVQDDGPGIPADLGQRIFTPFVSGKDRGHGLGLALSQRVLTYLGGRITWLQDAPGRGATFRIEAPLVSTGSKPAVKPMAHEECAAGGCP